MISSRRLKKYFLTLELNAIQCKKGVKAMDIIKRLEIYRLENKISQENLAKKLSVAFSTVNRWLNDKARPNKIQSYHIEKLLKRRK